MPRERRTAAKFKGDPDGPGDLKTCGQPESPSSKKRRTVNTPNQTNSALPDLIPPQPLSGFGETIVASNPFDDTVPASTATTVPNMPVSGLTHMSGPPMHNKPVPISSGKIYPPDQCMVFNPQIPMLLQFIPVGSAIKKCMTMTRNSL